MSRLLEFYHESDKCLIKKVEELFLRGEFDLAYSKIKERLATLETCKTKNDYYLKLELAGFLIDIADVAQLEQAAIDGLQILTQEKENVKEFVPESNTEYNIGNAKSALFKIQRAKPLFEYRPKNITYLLESKNHYWKAYKSEIDIKSKFAAELLVNLANSLSNCGRVVESLQYYDLVIKNFPEHPEANASRGKELLWLNQLTGILTQNLLFQSMKGYEIALKATHIPFQLIEHWKGEVERIKTYLQKIGYDLNNSHIDKEETEKEYESLSDYRKFCINEKLTLSEHSLYCNCLGARRDDLGICQPSEPMGGEYIPSMEKILNRLKSEYTFARLLYYYSTIDKDDGFTSYDQEVVFTELYDAEYINNKSEMLRTSFRMNFGILDKIASAICYIYDLSDKNEPIYFERFWNPKNKNNSSKQNERWEKINSIDNISLLALYTQATDLDSGTGEWSFFKSWRNDLEHNQISLLSVEEQSGDMFNIYKNGYPFSVVDKDYFQVKTLQMLQFTRSAIFNFVFLVRNEAKKSPDKDIIAIPFTLRFKNDSESIL